MPVSALQICMRHPRAVLISACLFSWLAYGQVPASPPHGTTPGAAKDFHVQLSNAEKQHLLDGQCTPVTATGAIPPAVREIFARATREKSFALAAPGHRFQETDVIEPWGRGLPLRRLVFAGTCQNRWFIYYEKGGFARSRAVLVFDVDPDGAARFVWGGTGCYPVTTVEDLRHAIAFGKCADDREYYW
jgi:hypothetical protein